MNPKLSVGTLFLTGYIAIFIFLLYSGSFEYSPESDFFVQAFIAVTMICAISGILLIPKEILSTRKLLEKNFDLDAKDEKDEKDE